MFDVHSAESRKICVKNWSQHYGSVSVPFWKKNRFPHFILWHYNIKVWIANLIFEFLTLIFEIQRLFFEFPTLFF